ncbi:hypothetical protein [Antribacter gilvus]|uniref:hypothetical protein n=1 Tax=Antribacter gilvus TaxID=2304675 RepID=UPI000F77355F|nr:hypothetical protein [Antribacter gilvus]
MTAEPRPTVAEPEGVEPRSDHKARVSTLTSLGALALLAGAVLDRFWGVEHVYAVSRVVGAALVVGALYAGYRGRVPLTHLILPGVLLALAVVSFFVVR